MIPQFNDNTLWSNSSSNNDHDIVVGGGVVSHHLHPMQDDSDSGDRATKRQKGDYEHEQPRHDNGDFVVLVGVGGDQQEQKQQPAQAQSLEALIAKKYRRVSFAPVTDIHSTEWTTQEVESCWYTKEELAVFKLDRKIFVKALKKVQFDVTLIDQSQHCLRGYEAYFSIKANKEYKAKRQMVWGAVLQEQCRQRYLRIVDPFMMQLISSHATQWARDTATDLAFQDAQVALEIFMEYMHEQQEDFDDDEEEYDDDIVDFHNCNNSGDNDYHYRDNNTSSVGLMTMLLEDGPLEATEEEDVKPINNKEGASSSSPANNNDLYASMPLQAQQQPQVDDNDWEPLQWSPSQGSHNNNNNAYGDVSPQHSPLYYQIHPSHGYMPHHYLPHLASSSSSTSCHSPASSSPPLPPQHEHQLVEVAARTC